MNRITASKILRILFFLLFLPMITGAGCNNLKNNFTEYLPNNNEIPLPEKLQMEIIMTKKETDSKGFGNTYVMTFDNTNVTNTISHWSLAGTVTQSEQYTLTDKRLSNLITFIKENKLNTNLKEDYPLENTGYAIEIQTKINIDGIKTEAKLAGMFNWYTEEKNNTKIKNLDYYHNIQQIVSAIIENKILPIKGRKNID